LGTPSWKDFGLTAVVCSIATTIGLTALTLHAAAEQRVRELRKKQEGQLNELASSVPIWKLCEHTPLDGCGDDLSVWPSVSNKCHGCPCG
jgi:hypothetical protein